MCCRKTWPKHLEFRKSEPTTGHSYSVVVAGRPPRAIDAVSVCGGRRQQSGLRQCSRHLGDPHQAGIGKTQGPFHFPRDFRSTVLQLAFHNGRACPRGGKSARPSSGPIRPDARRSSPCRRLHGGDSRCCFPKIQGPRDADLMFFGEAAGKWFAELLRVNPPGGSCG